MLRCCALVSLFCSVLLFGGATGPMSAFADDPVAESPEKTAPETTLQEPEETSEQPKSQADVEPEETAEEDAPPA